MNIKRLTIGVALALGLGTTGDVVLAQRQTPSVQGAASAKPAGQTGQPQPNRPPQGQPRKPWWTDETTKKELALTAEQAKTLDQIFTSTKDELSGYWEAYQRENKELDRLIDESKVEQWVVLRQIEKTEAQRSNFNKLRVMTLYRMHRVLTPDQRTKLQQIRDRDHRDPRKRP